MFSLENESVCGVYHLHECGGASKVRTVSERYTKGYGQTIIQALETKEGSRAERRHAEKQAKQLA